MRSQAFGALEGVEFLLERVHAAEEAGDGGVGDGGVDVVGCDAGSSLVFGGACGSEEDGEAVADVLGAGSGVGDGGEQGVGDGVGVEGVGGAVLEDGGGFWLGGRRGRCSLLGSV